MEQSVPISSNTFWGPLFLKKAPPTITEGGQFDPHWPITRINPGSMEQMILKSYGTHTMNYFASLGIIMYHRHGTQR